MMRKCRGIVCEKKATYSIFLTEDGEFLRGTPLIADVQIGEEAEFYLIAAAKPSNRTKPIFIAPALVAAVLLLLLVASWFPQTTPAYAYINVEGDSTIEIGVDEKGNVISFDSTTEVIKDWEGQSIDLVLAKAVEQVSTDQKELVVTTVYEKEDKPKTNKQIEKAVKKAKSPKEDSSSKTKNIPNVQQPSKQVKTKPPVQTKKEEKAPTINREQEKVPTIKSKQEKSPLDKSNKKESNNKKEEPNNNKEQTKPTNNSSNNPGQEKKKNEDKSINETNNGNNSNSNKNNGNNGNNENENKNNNTNNGNDKNANN